MKEINWDEYKCRASALGTLFTEPKLKSEKEAGALSATAKSHLIKVYKEEYWGRRKDISTKQMQKGIVCEPELIKLIGYIDGKEYVKNTERKTNDWVTGEPDIVLTDMIIDGKASYEPDTFLPHLLLKLNKKEGEAEKIDKDYYCQLQAYMWLFKKPKARLAYGLVNADDSTINKERYWLLNNMDVVTEENPEYRKAEMELLLNLTFDDLPASERCIIFDVKRDEELIKQIPEKVTKAREFLKRIHDVHTKLNVR